MMIHITKQIAMISLPFASLLLSATFCYATVNQVEDCISENCENCEKKIDRNDDRPRMEEFYAFWNSEESKDIFDDGRNIIETWSVSHWMGCDSEAFHSWSLTEVDQEVFSKIPTDDDFALLVEAYLYAMGSNDDTNSTMHKGGKYRRPASVSGYSPNVFQVPIEIKSAAGKGRGIFAKEAIQSGTRIVKPTNAMEFYTKEAFRDFLAYLVLKRSQLVCDIFMWLYVTRKSPALDDYTICVDADRSSLINGNYEDDDQDDEDYPEDCDGDCAIQINIDMGVNIAQFDFSDERTLYGCQDAETFAIRDIEAGEELIMNYADFSETEGFETLGIIH